MNTVILKAKVIFLVVSFVFNACLFVLKTMRIRACLSTSNYIFSFGNFSILKIVTDNLADCCKLKSCCLLFCVVVVHRCYG